MAILLTDGQQTRSGDFIEPKVAAQPLRSTGIRLVAVGIGKGAQRSELEAIAVVKENVHMLKNFRKLLSHEFVSKFIFGCRKGKAKIFCFVQQLNSSSGLVAFSLKYTNHKSSDGQFESCAGRSKCGVVPCCSC